LSYKIKFLKYIYKCIFIFLIISLAGCHFEPVYKNENIISELCSIQINNIKPSAQIYEVNFKNELQYILCDKKLMDKKYTLDWEINRSFKELIKSESNFTRRHEETLKVTFSLTEESNGKVIYSDSIISIGAYNILEDEIISTKASKESLDSDVSLNAARLVLDKLYLFIRRR